MPPFRWVQEDSQVGSMAENPVLESSERESPMHRWGWSIGRLDSAHRPVARVGMKRAVPMEELPVDAAIPIQSGNLDEDNVVLGAEEGFDLVPCLLSPEGPL